MDRGGGRLPLRPRPPSARAGWHAGGPHGRGTGDDRRLEAEYDKLEAEYAERRRTARRGGSSGSARSRRRSPHSRIGRSATIRPTSPAPASSSASTTTAACPSIAAMSGPRTKRRSPDGDGDARADAECADGAEPAAPTVQRAVITIGGEGRTGGRRGRRHHAPARPARQRADRASDAGAARRGGERTRTSR